MTRRPMTLRGALAAMLLAAVLLVQPAARAETLVGSSMESRVVLGFKVNDAGAQAWLPEGWTTFTLPQGPLSGVNLLVVLIDRHLVRDPEGKPLDPPEGTAAALVGFATKEGEQGPRMFVLRTYEPAPMANSYDNSVEAAVTRTAQVESGYPGAKTRSEDWSVIVAGGGEIAFDLSYEPGAAAWAPGQEALPYSAVKPDFHRIYRYDQLFDLAMNGALGRPLKGDVSFTSNIPELAPMFDGSEALVAVGTVPIYVREIWLP